MEHYSNTSLKQILASLSKNAAGLNFNFNFAKYPPCIADIAEKAEKVCDAVSNYALNKWSSNVSDWKTLNGSSLDVALKLAEDLQNGHYASLKTYKASFSFESITGIHPSPSGGMTNPSIAKELFRGAFTVKFYYAKDHLKFVVETFMEGSGLASLIGDPSKETYKFLHGLENELSRFSTLTPLKVKNFGPSPWGEIVASYLEDGTLKCSSGDLKSEVSQTLVFESLFKRTRDSWTYEKKNAYTSDGDTADVEIQIFEDRSAGWVLSCDPGLALMAEIPYGNDLETAKEKALELALLVEDLALLTDDVASLKDDEHNPLNKLTKRMRELENDPYS
jgi:hypothetical protein